MSSSLMQSTRIFMAPGYPLILAMTTEPSKAALVGNGVQRSCGRQIYRASLPARSSKMLVHLLTLVALAGAVFASYGKNLNYRSPSHHHPSLGVSVHRVNKRNAGSAPIDAAQLNFTHGVASGDPYPNSVIIWTRCAPIADDVNDNTTVSGTVPLYNPVPIYKIQDGYTISNAPVCLHYVIASDKGLSKNVQSGTVYTSSDVDYTVKV